MEGVDEMFDAHRSEMPTRAVRAKMMESFLSMIRYPGSCRAQLLSYCIMVLSFNDTEGHGCSNRVSAVAACCTIVYVCTSPVSRMRLVEGCGTFSVAVNPHGLVVSQVRFSRSRRGLGWISLPMYCA